MVNALDIAARIKAKKKPADDAAEEGSDEEEATEPAAEAAAEGDDTGADDGADADGEMGDYDSIEDSAVQDIMNSKDAATVKTALRQFVKACIDRDSE